VEGGRPEGDAFAGGEPRADGFEIPGLGFVVPTPAFKEAGSVPANIRPFTANHPSWPSDEFLDDCFAQRHTGRVVDLVMYPGPDARISGFFAYRPDEFGPLWKEISQYLRLGGRERGMVRRIAGEIGNRK
jgi:hypothetical protein